MVLCEAVKAIRLEMGLSQKELAKKLHISFAAVNRWENGHTKPNLIARYALIELAKQYDINNELIKAFEDTE
ncbi:MAG: helix-turn-helix transcriptional regulator [Oscillospiraceae bacterium]